MTEHQALRLLRQRANGQAVRVRVFADEVGGEGEDIVLALTQRRNLQVDDVQAIEKVFAEAASRTSSARSRLEVAMMRMLTGDGLAAADAVDHALLDGAQELRLQAHFHFADFIEEQRAAVGLFELADAAGDGAGERAFLVAEEFGLEEVLGDRRAVDRDERLLGARRSRMDITRDDFLTDAGFAGDEDRGVGRCHLLG